MLTARDKKDGHGWNGSLPSLREKGEGLRARHLRRTFPPLFDQTVKGGWGGSARRAQWHGLIKKYMGTTQVKKPKAIRKSQLQQMARRRLSVRVTNQGLNALSMAVATQLGKPWTGGKNSGYELLQEFVGVMPIVAKPLKGRQRRVYLDNAPCWTRPDFDGDVNSDSFLSSYEWRRVRMIALKQHGARCQCCGATANDGIRLHVDHIKPRRNFPGLALDTANLQVLCEVCNHGKGNWDSTDWRPKDTLSDRRQP